MGMNRVIRTLTFAAAVLAFSGSALAQGTRVPGTSVTLTPPDGFSAARRYPGFERADVQASIIVTELPVSAADMIRSMTAPALADKGMTLRSSREVVIGKSPGRLFETRQDAPGGPVLKWMLVAGDAKMTIMVVGTFPEAAPSNISDALRQSVLTASWGSADSAGSAPRTPFEGLPFRLTPTAKLKLARRQGNMLMFSESGTTGSPGSTEALYIAGQSAGQEHIDDMRLFSEARAKQTTLAGAVGNFKERAIQVDGADAYELEADAVDVRNNRPIRIYQVIIADEGGYFILQGLSRADRADQMFREFRTLTASFHRVTSQ
jgi:hypothetical protein